MKPPEENENRDTAAIEAEAMAWLAERDEGFAPGRTAAFDAWRRRDPRHAASVAELEQVLAQLDGLAARREEVNAHFNRVSPSPPAGRATPGLETTPVVNVRWWRSVAWSGLAAALLLSAFLGFRALQSPTSPETRYATTTAGYERARLDDGSTLELNTASVARVQFTAAERRVELESGEAHFEVAHDTARPFVVSAGGVTVRAVGTAFNVRFVSGAVEVTVTEGKVSVGPALVAGPSRNERDIRAGTPASGGPTVLSANQRLALPLAPTAAPAPAPVIEPLAPAEVRAVLAWQRRVTDFSDTPLAEVTARFNRHNVLQLVITDPALGSRRIGGIFALDDVEAFVRLLARDGIIRAERQGDTLLLRAP
jgi:transmembrane sensor